DRPIERAWIHATSLGIHELRLNSARVGQDYFSPGWTDYDKRVYYSTYDVTDLVHPGRNALAAVLADGWYAGYIGYGKERNHYGHALRFSSQLHVEFTDGTEAVIATGPSWRASLGPIVEADFLMGETYDARREMPGWDGPGFDDETWAHVDVTETIGAAVEANPGVPVRAFAELPPLTITEPEKGVFVFDLGRNFAGVTRLKVRGEAGRKITLRFAERLNPDGTIYTENLRAARATDMYICSGGAPETWQPRFTYHGFQYVEVRGLAAAPDADTITGIALSSQTPSVGTFECSDPIVNQLFSNIQWTQRANFMDIPTDCPQRDERLGWTGDAQIYIRSACLNSDCRAFYDKWLVDLFDAQREDGQFPMVAPLKVAGGDGGPGWADAGVICPWTLYEIYGSAEILEKYYAGMVRFIEFMTLRSPGLLPPAEFHCFGDWLNIDAETPKEVIYTAYFAHSTLLVARAARVLGKKEDEARYFDRFLQIRRAFNEAYVSEDGTIKGETQCGYVMALAFDLLDEAKQAQAAALLVADIEKRGNRLSTGFLGTKDLMLVLTRIGRTDVAYRLLHNNDFPSWGYSIRHGATSIWERWNGWTPEQGFADPGMNSFSHYSFGAVAQWIYETVAGIRAGSPGFKKIVIAPEPGGRIRWCQAAYRSIHGEIAVAWKRADQRFSCRVTIPADTVAEVHLPTSDLSRILENGGPVQESEGVRLLGERQGFAVIEIGSGCYSFESPFSREK
ncbi:MAG: glycoside hydrolase family 78 protein, partial [Planctomycetota bacterium]